MTCSPSVTHSFMTCSPSVSHTVRTLTQLHDLPVSHQQTASWPVHPQWPTLWGLQHSFMTYLFLVSRQLHDLFTLSDPHCEDFNTASWPTCFSSADSFMTWSPSVTHTVRTSTQALYRFQVSSDSSSIGLRDLVSMETFFHLCVMSSNRTSISFTSSGPTIIKDYYKFVIL